MSPLEVDVAIAGAGPVGLLLACLLRARGLSVAVLERRASPSTHSAAIGITPPSLRILGSVGADRAVIDAGVKVRDCHLHGRQGPLGRVSFRDIPDDHRFILSLPQSETAALLRRRLGDGVVRDGWEVTGLSQDDAGVVLITAGGEVRARYAVGCDGARSRVREALGIRAPGRRYGFHFVMADFVDRSGLGDEAHLFFKPEGSVESFPLPGSLRRWVVQTDLRVDSPPPGLVADLVRRRTGFALGNADQLNAHAFTPRRFNCERYHDGRVALCGDAAHGMSPAGGQGMNTGFADAEFLAEVLASPDPRALLPAYTRYRRRAASAAIFRAGWGMSLGTWTGRPLSVLRDGILRHVLCRGPIGRRMGSFYAMLTIPFNTLAAVPARALRAEVS
jgi:2-polyprenyl-6-methoxyphenol hydroxylase-like FAD-dependent oxidoreductase